MWIRFHPKSRASTDHTPGPSSANAAPRIAMRTQIHGFARLEAACTNARIASSVPAIGVHKPTITSSPTAMVITCSVAGPNGGAPRNARTPRATTPIPAARRSKSRPSPGAPPAKFEKSRRTTMLGYKVRNLDSKPERARQNTLWSDRLLNLYNSALHSNHGGVGAIIGPQFGEDVSDLALHRVFTHGQLRCDLFIGIAFGD